MRSLYYKRMRGNNIQLASPVDFKPRHSRRKEREAADGQRTPEGGAKERWWWLGSREGRELSE